ncbi:MAG: 3-oxoacyl-[acyl-carrier-protein] reductase [Ignavibacteria bacterium]|nr:MAG: 3-oxoacyl-[acyl-carrier-protein] reductase [Ignavibacteria bacterium]
MGRLDNKVALVTGGSRGIGRAIALKLAQDGAHVMISYRTRAPEAQEVVEGIKKSGRRSAAYQSDASMYQQAKETIEQIVKDFKRLDILINNAGITKDGLLLRMAEEDWDSVINTNLKSVFNYTKAALHPMMSQKSGKIVNLTSVTGITGNAGQTNYAASKAGIIGFTKSLAKEVGSRNIQVNAVAPGFVETEMTAKLTEVQRQKLAENIPLKRTATPEDIAGVVNFLASPDSDYITGQVICVDGGLAM